MTDYRDAGNVDGFFRKEDFDIGSLQDEIRADQLCGRFLRLFYLDLVEWGDETPSQAGTLAHGADYFLREFLIPDRRDNIFSPRPGRVRQFAGNWYIVKNMEPNMEELCSILRGVEAFYFYCQKIGKVSLALAEEIREECRQIDFFRKRIEDFWAIRNDGYLAWERECSLKE